MHTRLLGKNTLSDHNTHQRKVLVMLSLFKTTIAVMTFILFANLAIPTSAQEISSTSTTSPTILTDNTPVTDTTQTGTQEKGQIDINGGTFNVPSVTVGTDDGIKSTTWLLVIDSVAGGDDVVTFEGDIIITTGATNPDDLIFLLDYPTSNASVGMDFKGNLLAGDGSISMANITGANPTTFTFSNQTIDLGTGGIIFTHLDDTLLFNGTTAQIFTGSIAGLYSDGHVVIDNAAGVTFVNGIGTDSSWLGHVTIAGSGTDSMATVMDVVYTDFGVTMGDGEGSDTNTLIFDTSNGDFLLKSNITGTAGDTDNLIVTGGNTLTQEQYYNFDIDNLTITGSGTTVLLQNTNDANYVSGTVTVDSGTRLRLAGWGLSANGIINDGVIEIVDDGYIPDIMSSVSGSGTLEINDSVYVGGSIAQSAVNIADGVQFVISASNYTVPTTTLNGTAMIVLNNYDSIITGDIVSDATGNGSVIFDSDLRETQIINGNIGTSADHTVGMLQILSRSSDPLYWANTVQTTGNLFVDTIYIANALDVLQFTGSSAQAVTSSFYGDGSVIIGDGSSASNVTFSGDVSGFTGNFNVMSNASATLANTFTTTGSLSVDGTLTINQGVNATFADIAAGSAQGSLVLTIGTDGVGDENSATLITTGGALDFANLDGTNANTATLSLRVGKGVITDGQEFLIIDSASTVANFTNGATVSSPSALYDFVLSDGATATLGTDDSDIVVTANRVDLQAVTKSQSNASVLAAILNVTPEQVNADPVLASVLYNVQNADDPDEAAESVQAAVDGGLVLANNAFSDAAVNANNMRLVALRTGDMTGIAAGDAFAGMKIWTQGFGKIAQQHPRDNINGFNLRTYGAAWGVDKELNDLTLGLAMSYGGSTVGSKDINRTNTQVDSYQLSLYGDYDLGNNMYVSGSVYYAYHNVKTTRHDVGGVLGLDANGDFDANQFGARLELGRDYQWRDILITPRVLTNFSYYDADSYTETGAGPANLTVDYDAVTVFELGVGVDAKWSLQQNNGAVLEPTLSVEYRHDFVGDEVETNSSFTGTGASFQTKGFEPALDTLSLGASVTYFSENNWEFTVDYNYEIKSDYDSHAFSLKLAYNF